MKDVIINAVKSATKQVVKFARTGAGKATIFGTTIVGGGLLAAKVFGKNEEIEPECEGQCDQEPAEAENSAEETNEEVQPEEA